MTRDEVRAAARRVVRWHRRFAKLFEGPDVASNPALGHNRPHGDRIVGEDLRPLLLEPGAIGGVLAGERHHVIGDRVELLVEEDGNVGGHDITQVNDGVVVVHGAATDDRSVFYHRSPEPP